MPTYGPNSPTSGVNTDRGFPAWSLPERITTSDNLNAQASLGISQTSDYLDATGFGFAVPSGESVVGILVEWEKAASVAGRAKDETVRMLDAGSPVGTNKADTVTTWGTTDAYVSYGGSSDAWGFSWTPAKINATNFGVRMAASNGPDGSVNAFADHVRVTVYTVPAVSVTDALSLADALAMKMGKVLTEAMTLAEALAMKTGKVLTDSASLADAVSTVLIRTVSVTDALSILDALSLKTGKVLTDSLTVVDTVEAFVLQLPTIQTRYAPRPLITLTVGAETKRYSTETLVVPAAAQYGEAQYGESEYGGN